MIQNQQIKSNVKSFINLYWEMRTTLLVFLEWCFCNLPKITLHLQGKSQKDKPKDDPSHTLLLSVTFSF